MDAATYERWMAARITHGQYSGGKESPEHYVWRSMLIRCDGKHRNYEHVSVTPRWFKYENFIADMGIRPSFKHTLDRYPDPWGNYEPGNCRWATWTEQANNKRTTLLFRMRGSIDTLSGWAKRLGLSRPGARYRFARWGSFIESEFCEYKNINGNWKSRAAIPKARYRKDARFFVRDGVVDNISGWAKRLNISTALAHLRINTRGTFERGRDWCEL